MKHPRRQFLHLAAAAAALPAVSRIAWAQAYPARSVRIVVGGPAGGPADITMRLIGQWLSERLGQTFVIENRSVNNVAIEAVARAPADGYTLGMVAAANAVNATFFENPNFNLIRDIAPIAGLIRFPNVMEVNSSFPAKTVPEFIAHAKANPGKVSIASPGVGTTQHLTSELFKIMTRVDIIQVPYRGSAPMLTDLLAGQVEGAFDPIPGSIEHIRSGRLRALAVTGATRSDALPDIPTLGEFVPGFEASAWFGLGAPKNTPAAIIERLNKEINAGLADPRITARLVDLVATPLALSAADFGKLITDETEKWGKIVRATNIKAG